MYVTAAGDISARAAVGVGLCVGVVHEEFTVTVSKGFSIAVVMNLAAPVQQAETFGTIHRVQEGFRDSHTWIRPSST